MPDIAVPYNPDTAQTEAIFEKGLKNLSVQYQLLAKSKIEISDEEKFIVKVPLQPMVTKEMLNA